MFEFIDRDAAVQVLKAHGRPLPPEWVLNEPADIVQAVAKAIGVSEGEATSMLLSVSESRPAVAGERNPRREFRRAIAAKIANLWAFACCCELPVEADIFVCRRGEPGDAGGVQPLHTREG